MADYLLQFARHLIYSTAMPPAQAVALSAALGIIRSDEGQQRRDILAARIRQFREGMGEVSLGLTDSVSAIQPLIVGDNARALNLACRLRDAGCWATAIRPPTVPVGSARLRLTRNMMNCSGAAPIYCCASWRAAILRRCWMPAAAPAV